MAKTRKAAGRHGSIRFRIVWSGSGEVVEPCAIVHKRERLERVTTFEPPGPGTWELDRSHYDSAVTPIIDQAMCVAVEAAYRKLFSVLGVPARTVAMRPVNGFVYSQVVPYFGSSISGKTPPDWLIKLVFRLHPELRRRERLAAQALDGEGSRKVIADWHAQIRPHLVERNLAYQQVDLAKLDDVALAGHATELIGYLHETFEEHHRLHGYDIGPLAIYVVSCAEWGISAGDALAALAGASPSTTLPRRQLAAIRSELEAAGAAPTSLDEVRAASPKAAELLDAYLEHHGSIVFSSYDLDSPTLGERPELILTTILHAAHPQERDASARAAAVRARVPAHAQAEFDRILVDARNAMDMRDDNGPVTVEWPVGLLRLALIEAGKRLEASGLLQAVDHIFSIEPDEVRPLVAHGDGPSAAELAGRHRARVAQRALEPPQRLGPEPQDPPTAAMPPAMARTLEITMAALEALGMTETAPAGKLTGAGIGDEPVRGRARVALTAEDALMALEPGEILVTRATSPAFNLVLSLAGGLVTVDGGPMSHAAVLSRELGLVAVIGVGDCLDHISDGAIIELDPSEGCVRLVP